MVINTKTYTSPNFSTRKGVSIDTLIIHHTGGLMPGCANWLCDPRAKASAHYVITRKGEIYQLVADDLCAWHAGVSEYDFNADGDIAAGERSINRRSIGIELEWLPEKPYTLLQLEANSWLSLEIVKRYNIPIPHILGHKEIAPNRKIDPANFDMFEFRNKIQSQLILDGIQPILDRIGGKIPVIL
ncbi:N-acetylmuramoyl-L-alanine amidase [Acinetobacter sp.]|uniref:N-acetylmuramoyl-L-alanine amidase n=1 Tax=Acinetobacter sp. TaxID=472 RepID=UPI003D04E64B